MFDDLRNKLFLVEAQELNENGVAKVMEGEEEDEEIMEILGLDASDDEPDSMVDLASLPEDDNTIMTESVLDLVLEACGEKSKKKNTNVVVEDDDLDDTETDDELDDELYDDDEFYED
jgi:hypothetical protein